LTGHLISRFPQSQWIFSAALVFAALSLFEILDLYELPFESAFSFGSATHFLPGLTSALLASGYLGLFALMLLESMALPIPSEVFLPMTGYLIYTGKMSFGAALAVSTLGGLVGSLLIFYLAMILGRPIVYSIARRVGVSKVSLAESEGWLSGKGSVAVLIARFVPGIRSSISIPAGVLKMNVGRFSIVTAAGSLGWSFILMYIGYSIDPANLASPISSSLIGEVVLYAVAIVSVSYSLYYLLAKYERSRKSALAPYQAEVRKT